MALYAFDGTGDRWSPGTRWNLKDLRELTQEQKDKLIATVTPDRKTDKDRFLTNVVFFYKEYIESGLHAEYFPGVGSGALFTTKIGITLDFIFGGAFGIGAQGIINQAFGKLKKISRKMTNISILLATVEVPQSLACLQIRFFEITNKYCQVFLSHHR